MQQNWYVEIRQIRPIKVQFRTSSDVDLLLRRACKLKSSEEFSGVYLAPDRTPEQRAARNKLVQQKELIIKDSSKDDIINAAPSPNVDLLDSLD